MVPYILVLLSCFGIGSYGQKTEVKYTVLEEQSPLTFVGNVADDSNIKDNLTSDIISQLRFQIFKDGSTAYNTLFTINQYTGRLETSQKIDREVVCQPTSTCVLGLSIAVFKQNNELMEVIKVSVTVKDINDNSPQFEESSIHLEVSEASNIGHTLLTSTAKDEDSGNQNSVQTYELLSGAPTFGLKIVKSPDDSENLGIVVERQLNREEVDFYQLTILAKDAGFPQRNGTLIVNITVVDTNDNKPEFQTSPYNVTIPEDVNVGTLVLKVSANDDDIGENARISYIFSSRVSAKVTQVFDLDETSGEIKVKNIVDYEEESHFQFVIIARDNGLSPLSSQVIVHIHILDINDNAPQININLPPGGTAVFEDAEIGRLIATVIVSDPDSGNNGTVTCSTKNGQFDLKKMYKDIYKIVLKNRLDRERKAIHNVTVECSDLGVPKKTNRTFITLNIGDINDNFPIFNQSVYKADLSENNVIGVKVLQVFAEDKDAGINGQITFMLQDYSQDYFAIHSTSGMISANYVFDRENITEVSFLIVARDNGISKFSSTATVIVTIEDKNDIKPIFSKNSYVFHVAENQAKGAVIGNFTAQDLDVGLNGEFKFSQDKVYSDVFVVDTIDKNGFLKTAGNLDREKQSEFHFNIYVTDKGSPPLISTAAVSVFLQDVNDNAPVIFYPNNKNNTVKLSLSVLPKTTIAKVIASDFDLGSNALLSYHIIQGNSRSLFSISNSSGDIIIERSIVEDDSGTYTLVLAVQDAGIPVRTTWTNLAVIIAEKSQSQNLIIVISVCSITVVISLALIVIICIIRKKDKAKDSEVKVQFQHKSLLRKCLACLTSTKDDSLNRRDTENNNKPDMLVSSVTNDRFYTQLVRSSNINITQNDTSSMEQTPPDSGHGDSVEVGSEIYKSDMDLASVPPPLTFVDKSGQYIASVQSEENIPNNSHFHQLPQSRYPQYQRVISLDEHMLHRPPKQRIYFARFRSSSESDQINQERDQESRDNLSHSSSFKHNMNLSNSYSGPFLSQSLDRHRNSPYNKHHPHFSHHPSRTAIRRELPTISASPNPYDPIQELTEISYQEKLSPHTHYKGHRKPPELQSQTSHDSMAGFSGQTSQTDNQSQHTLASFAINPPNFDNVFRQDIVV